jgi:nucleoid-associated protein YgaU
MGLDDPRSISPYERWGQYLPDEDANLIEYAFRAGDTISGLAHRFYGDWRFWRVIAERNKLEDVRQIPIGKVLLIPERPLEKGKFEIG